jgi:hypothetical protein
MQDGMANVLDPGYADTLSKGSGKEGGNALKWVSVANSRNL